MHEASIATELLNIAIQECLKNGYKKIDSINVIVGKATGIMKDALLFAFDILKEGTLAEGATLRIEEIPVRIFCKNCGKITESDENFVIFECPNCSSFSVDLISGKELNITEMEVSNED